MDSYSRTDAGCLVRRMPARDLRAGMSLVERDGALIEIASVETLPRGMVRLTFARGMWIMPVSPLTCRGSRLLPAVEGRS